MHDRVMPQWNERTVRCASPGCKSVGVASAAHLSGSDVTAVVLAGDWAAVRIGYDDHDSYACSRRCIEGLLWSGRR